MSEPSKPDPTHADQQAPGETAKPQPGNLLQLAGAVFWAFFGVRKSVHYARDIKNLNPVHVIIAGIVGAAIFIAILIFLVKWVIASGVAAA